MFSTKSLSQFVGKDPCSETGSPEGPGFVEMLAGAKGTQAEIKTRLHPGEGVRRMAYFEPRSRTLIGQRSLTAFPLRWAATRPMAPSPTRANVEGSGTATVSEKTTPSL